MQFQVWQPTLFWERRLLRSISKRVAQKVRIVTLIYSSFITILDTIFRDHDYRESRKQRASGPVGSRVAVRGYSICSTWTDEQENSRSQYSSQEWPASLNERASHLEATSALVTHGSVDPVPGAPFDLEIASLSS